MNRKIATIPLFFSPILLSPLPRVAFSELGDVIPFLSSPHRGGRRTLAVSSSQRVSCCVFLLLSLFFFPSIFWGLFLASFIVLHPPPPIPLLAAPTQDVRRWRIDVLPPPIFLSSLLLLPTFPQQLLARPQRGSSSTGSSLPPSFLLPVETLCAPHLPWPDPSQGVVYPAGIFAPILCPSLVSFLSFLFHYFSHVCSNLGCRLSAITSTVSHHSSVGPHQCPLILTFIFTSTRTSPYFS